MKKIVITIITLFILLFNVAQLNAYEEKTLTYFISSTSDSIDVLSFGHSTGYNEKTDTFTFFQETKNNVTIKMSETGLITITGGICSNDSYFTIPYFVKVNQLPQEYFISISNSEVITPLDSNFNKLVIFPRIDNFNGYSIPIDIPNNERRFNNGTTFDGVTIKVLQGYDCELNDINFTLLVSDKSIKSFFNESLLDDVKINQSVSQYLNDYFNQYTRANYIGYENGYEIGYENGYENGYEIGVTQQFEDTPLVTWVQKLLTASTSLLNVQIGNVTIGAIILIPLSISIVAFIIRMWKGGQGD